MVVNFTINNSIAKTSGFDTINFEVVLLCSDNNFIESYFDASPTMYQRIDSNVSALTNGTISSTKQNGILTTTVSNYVIENTDTSNLRITYTINDTGNDMASLYYNNKPTFSVKVRMI